MPPSSGLGSSIALGCLMFNIEVLHFARTLVAIYHARFEVLTAFLLRILVVWDMTWHWANGS
jgi:hypothetical protein